MIRWILIVLGLLAVIAVAALSGTLFTVHQTQQAIVLQFGEPKRVITDPGLNVKIPFAQQVIFFDRRILDLDVEPEEVLALDQKRLIVDAFARFKITDPLKFYQTVNNEAIGRVRLSTFLNTSVREVLAEREFSTLLTGERSELMRQIRESVNAKSRPLGLDIVDVRIRRADLPEANSQAVFRRMESERQKEAAEARARGEEISRQIRAEADRDVTVLLAEARRDAEKLRGEGDARRNEIFAAAYGKDPDFFAFYRSMQAYEQALQKGDTTMVLAPDSEFFRYFGDLTGKVRQRR